MAPLPESLNVDPAVHLESAVTAGRVFYITPKDLT